MKIRWRKLFSGKTISKLVILFIQFESIDWKKYIKDPQVTALSVQLKDLRDHLVKRI